MVDDIENIFDPAKKIKIKIHPCVSNFSNFFWINHYIHFTAVYLRERVNFLNDVTYLYIHVINPFPRKLRIVGCLFHIRLAVNIGDPQRISLNFPFLSSQDSKHPSQSNPSDSTDVFDTSTMVKCKKIYLFLPISKQWQKISFENFFEIYPVSRDWEIYWSASFN